MNITTRTGLVGFFLALSALQISGATAATSQPNTDPTQLLESRLTRLTAAIRQRETLLPQDGRIPTEMLIAASGWGNGGGGGFANSAGGGGFANSGGFRNGGGFYNY
jgi:rSAM-associated Gly-rich repeat protein